MFALIRVRIQGLGLYLYAMYVESVRNFRKPFVGLGGPTLVFGRVASRHLCLGLFSKALVFAGLLWFGVEIGVYV